MTIGHKLITVWVLVVIVLIVFLTLAGCTKHINKPECDAKCQEFRDSIQRVFNSKKIS